MPETYRIAELEKALADLVAAAKPVDKYLKGRRYLKSREAEEFSTAVKRAQKLIGEE